MTPSQCESTHRSITRSPRLPRWSPTLGGLLLLLAALGAGCARSAEDVQQEFEEVVAESNACSAVEECTLITPGCPLPCYVAVNVASKDEVESRAEELVAAYERGGVHCAAECVAPGPLACIEGQCTMVPAE